MLLVDVHTMSSTTQFETQLQWSCNTTTGLNTTVYTPLCGQTNMKRIILCVVELSCQHLCMYVHVRTSFTASGLGWMTALLASSPHLECHVIANVSRYCNS